MFLTIFSISQKPSNLKDDILLPKIAPEKCSHVGSVSIHSSSSFKKIYKLQPIIFLKCLIIVSFTVVSGIHVSISIIFLLPFSSLMNFKVLFLLIISTKLENIGIFLSSNNKSLYFLAFFFGKEHSSINIFLLQNSFNLFTIFSDSSELIEEPETNRALGSPLVKKLLTALQKFFFTRFKS